MGPASHELLMVWLDLHKSDRYEEGEQEA